MIEVLYNWELWAWYACGIISTATALIVSNGEVLDSKEGIGLSIALFAGGPISLLALLMATQ